MAGFPWKGRKQSKYPKVGIIDCGLRLNWNGRKDEMEAMGRFMGLLWHLREWRIGHPYLNTVVLGPRGVGSGG